MTRAHRRPHGPAQPHPGAATRARWRNKREHVLRRLDADPTITHTGRAVARCLAQFSDNDAKACWPAQTTLAERLGVVPKTVSRGVAELEAAGYLSVRRHRPRYHPERAGFARQTNCYVLRLPKGPITEYREGQRRRYRSAEWKAKAQAWVAAHRPTPAGPVLGDSGSRLSPSGGAHPGATTPGCRQLPAHHNNESAATPPHAPPDTQAHTLHKPSFPGGGVTGAGGVPNSGSGERIEEPEDFEPNEELARETIAACKALLAAGRTRPR